SRWASTPTTARTPPTMRGASGWPISTWSGWASRRARRSCPGSRSTSTAACRATSGCSATATTTRSSRPRRPRSSRRWRPSRRWPRSRAVAPDAAGLAALFLVPARDGVGVSSGALVETRDPRAALDAARRVRPLVRAERRVRGGVVRSGTDAFRALARLRDSPTAAAAVDRWVVWGDPRAVRAAVVAANGRSLGETVPFRRAAEPFRDGPALVYLDPRALAGALVARAMAVPGRVGAALADDLLGVRFARPVAGRVHLHEHHVAIETGAEDGCFATPLAEAGGGPADAQLVAGMPVYGLAQRPC